MKVIVTGGAGFIGSEVCRQFVLDRRFNVLTIDKLSYGANLSSLRAVEGHSNYRFLKADICDAETVEQAFEDFEPDAVVHLAAESHVDRSIDGPAAFVQSNIVGTYVLLEAARRYLRSQPEARRHRFRFVHVSTDEVFGDLDETGVFNERSPYRPSSPYSATKASSDHLVRAWYRTFEVPVIVSNCSNNYGPYQFPEKLIPLMILKALRGQAMPIYGDGLQVRDWLHVSDHVEALALMLEQGIVGETYCVGGRAERTNLDIVNQICARMDERRPDKAPHDTLKTHVKDRPGHDRRYAVDPTKLERDLGWRACRSFETGLRETVDWYLANEAWWRPIVEHAYGGERLGQT